MVLEKTLESPLCCKEIQPVHPKGNQSWIFIGENDAEAETPILWPPDVKNWLTGKGPDAGKDWRLEEKGTTEDEMVRWHHWFNARVWVNSRSWWWTGSPGVLQSMGSQRVGHDWATELNWRKVRQGFLLSVSVLFAEVWMASGFLVDLGVSEFFQSALSHSRAALSPWIITQQSSSLKKSLRKYSTFLTLFMKNLKFSCLTGKPTEQRL